VNLSDILDEGAAQTLRLASQAVLEHGEDVRVGRWQGRPVTLDFRRFRTRTFERVHIARIRGAMESLTLLVTPRPELDAPGLAVDIVAKEGAVFFAALDLPACGASGLAPYQRRALVASGDLLKASGSPHRGSMAANVLSVDAAVARRPGLPETRLALDTHIEIFGERLAERRQSVDPTQRLASLEAYLQAMRQNRREQRALAAMFGEGWALRFMGEVFFGPPRLAESTTSTPPPRHS